MGDFSLKNGSTGNGIIGMLAAAFIFIVIPVSMVTLGMHTIDLVMADIEAGIVNLEIDAEMLQTIQDKLILFRDMAILYAIPIVILAFPKGFYPKGNFGRVPFGVLQSITMALWIWYITNGGIIPIDINLPLEIATGLNATITISFNLILTGFIYLFMMVALARGAYYFAEYGGNRRKYLEKKDEDQEPSSPENNNKGKDWEIV